MKPEDTIAAIATAAGVSAIGIVRLSGPRSIEIVNSLFPGKNLTEVASHTIHFGVLRDGEEMLDEVLVSIFRAPNSYTGEESVEVSCHGSPVVLQKVLEKLIEKGARHAGAGEFTQRAFLNGKLDLSQAEAVGDLICAESEAQRKSALYQMRGGFSNKIKELRSQLVDFASLIELELDFAEEDVEFAKRDEFERLLKHILAELDKLIASFKIGNVIKKGVSVVIAGRPNAGKSTLLNALLQEERAIVSEIAGTTRDTIEEVLNINGIPFRFIDTAGIREATDEIERIGVQRTHERISSSHLVIYMYDINLLSEAEVRADVAKLHLQQKPLIVANKIDLAKKVHKEVEPLYISSKTGEGVEKLIDALLERVNLGNIGSDYSMVTNARHYEALKNAHDAVGQVIEGLQNDLLTDLLTIDIRNALYSMGQITGEVTNDEILGNIFGKFCIGK